MLCLCSYNGNTTGQVYDAVIMIIAIARVHLMQTVRQVADNPWWRSPVEEHRSLADVLSLDL